MAKKNSDDGTIGCLLILIFLPFFLFFYAIKQLISIGKNYSVKKTQKNNIKTKTPTYYQKTKKQKTNTRTTPVEEDNEMVDLVGAQSLIESVTAQVKELNAEADKFLKTHHCAKCGKTLNKCKCKGKQEIMEISNNDELDWETHCESCGELLEDCECDNQELSLEDIAMMDMIDEDLEQDELDEELNEEEQEDDLSFDEFESFEDDDDRF